MEEEEPACPGGRRVVDAHREPDLTGFSIAAVDGDIGRIDRATYETGASIW